MALIKFNRTPYFDSHDPASNYLKVLFKPGRNIQVRELNEMQSIIHSQVKKFASNIFKNGSRVSGSRMALKTSPYVSLTTNDTNFARIEVGDMITDNITNMQVVVSDKIKFDGQYMVMYDLKAAGSSAETMFKAGSNVTVSTFSGDFIVSVFTDHTVKTFIVDSGVFYYDGFFINTTRQSIPVSFNSNIWTGHVGFNVIDEIVTHEQEDALLDNAADSSSKNSPGADRYKVMLQLTRRVSLDDQDSRFILLASIENGEISFANSYTSYAEFGDMLAQRTFEESGHYSLKPFSVRILEHKKQDTSDVFGFSVNGSEDNYAVLVESNISYVGGYRHEKPLESAVISAKKNGTLSMNNLKTRISNPAYFLATVVSPYSELVTSTSNQFAMEWIELFNGVISGGGVSGVKIGQARIRSVELDSGTMGTDSVYKMYVHEINISKGYKASDVKSMRVSSLNFIGQPAGTFAVVNDYNTMAIVKIGANTPIKTLKTASGQSSNVGAVVKQQYTGITTSGGAINLTCAAGQSFDQSNPPIVSIQDTTGWKTVNAVATYPSSTQCNLAAGAFASKNYRVTAGVAYTDIPLRTKTLTAKNQTITNVSAGPMTLGDSDLVRINTAVLKQKSNPVNEIDVSRFITFDAGRRDAYYTNASLSLATRDVDLSQYDLYVNYSYFVHSALSNGQGVFTVDSYSTDDYDLIPVHVTSLGDQFHLSNAIDFRPLYLNNLYDTGASIIKPLSEITYAAEMYQPRYDTLYMTKDGKYMIKSGEAGFNPVPPNMAEDWMAIADLKIPAYTTSAFDIKYTLRNTRRYTMKDIGGIEARIKTMEYYTSLSLLEKSASDMSIKDANGLDRFKNGFIADDFTQFQSGDVPSGEFKASLDRNRGELRPAYKSRNRKFRVVSSQSSNFLNNHGVLSYKFKEVEFQKQALASKQVSINYYFYAQQQGTLLLSPNVDTWSETSHAPAITFSVDTGAEAFRNVASRLKLLETEWGSWNAINQTIKTSSSWAGVLASRAIGSMQPADAVMTDKNITSAVNLQVETQWEKVGIAKTVQKRTDEHSWENITDMSIEPYVRPQEVNFFAKNLSPNTIFYIFFDQQNITAITQDLTSWKRGKLVSNASGDLYGRFTIPEKTFFVGEKEVLVATVPYYDQVGTDANFSMAKATYFAGGINLQKQEVNMQVITPNWAESQVVERKTTKSSIDFNSAPDAGAANLPADPAASVPKIFTQSGSGDWVMPKSPVPSTSPTPTPVSLPGGGAQTTTPWTPSGGGSSGGGGGSVSISITEITNNSSSGSGGGGSGGGGSGSTACVTSGFGGDGWPPAWPSAPDDPQDPWPPEDTGIDGVEGTGNSGGNEGADGDNFQSGVEPPPDA